jgi:hypothetical protein
MKRSGGNKDKKIKLEDGGKEIKKMDATKDIRRKE